MFWNDERVEELKKRWRDGDSASLIQLRVGAKSRCAVIGKVYRLGLPKRATTQRDKRIKSRLVSERAIAAQRAQALRVPPPSTLEKQPLPLPVPETGLVRVADLENHHCRWPIGDPQDSGFRMCGCQNVAGKPYCETHMARAFERKPASSSPHGFRLSHLDVEARRKQRFIEHV